MESKGGYLQIGRTVRISCRRNKYSLKCDIELSKHTLSYGDMLLCQNKATVIAGKIKISGA